MASQLEQDPVASDFVWDLLLVNIFAVGDVETQVTREPKGRNFFLPEKSVDSRGTDIQIFGYF